MGPFKGVITRHPGCGICVPSVGVQNRLKTAKMGPFRIPLCLQLQHMLLHIRDTYTPCTVYIGSTCYVVYTISVDQLTTICRYVSGVHHQPVLSCFIHITHADMLIPTHFALVLSPPVFIPKSPQSVGSWNQDLCAIFRTQNGYHFGALI